MQGALERLECVMIAVTIALFASAAIGAGHESTREGAGSRGRSIQSRDEKPEGIRAVEGTPEQVCRELLSRLKTLDDSEVYNQTEAALLESLEDVPERMQDAFRERLIVGRLHREELEEAKTLIRKLSSASKHREDFFKQELRKREKLEAAIPAILAGSNKTALRLLKGAAGTDTGKLVELANLPDDLLTVEEKWRELARLLLEVNGTDPSPLSPLVADRVRRGLELSLADHTCPLLDCQVHRDWIELTTLSERARARPLMKPWVPSEVEAVLEEMNPGTGSLKNRVFPKRSPFWEHHYRVLGVGEDGSFLCTSGGTQNRLDGRYALAFITLGKNDLSAHEFGIPSAAIDRKTFPSPGVFAAAELQKGRWVLGGRDCIGIGKFLRREKSVQVKDIPVDGLGDVVSLLSFSGGSNVVVSATSNCTVLDIKLGQARGSLPEELRTPKAAVAMWEQEFKKGSENSEWAVLVERKAPIARLVDLHTLEVIQEIGLPKFENESNGVAALSGTGARLWITAPDCFELVDLMEGTIVMRLERTEKVKSLRLSPDGKTGLAVMENSVGLIVRLDNSRRVDRITSETYEASGFQPEALILDHCAILGGHRRVLFLWF